MPADLLELVVFTVAGRRYGVPAAAVLAVCRNGADLPPDLPALPLRRLLGDRPGSPAVHLVLHRGRQPVCTLGVDEVAEVGQFPLRALHPLPWPLGARTSSGLFALYTQGDAVVPLFDPDCLLAAARPHRRRSRP